MHANELCVASNLRPACSPYAFAFQFPLFRIGGATGAAMKINLTSVMVTDQQQALDFYTEKLGFVKNQDVPMGEHRWLTVVSPEGAEGVELLLEPLGFEPAADFQRQLYKAGIPFASFESRQFGWNPFVWNNQHRLAATMNFYRYPSFQYVINNLI